MRLILCLLALAACHKPNPESLPKAPADTFTEAENHAVASTSPKGWIICTDAAGALGCFGDSLLFSGLAMGAADCEHGQIYEDAMVEMINGNDGALERYPGIPGASLDGALGFMWGMAKRAGRCADARPALAAAFSHWRSKSAGSLEPYFDVLAVQVLADLGLGDPPSEHDRGVLGAELAGWAFADAVSQSAAYRIHLGYLGLSLVDAPKGRASYCAAVEKAKMPLIEHFCGRPGLSEWLGAFRYDQIEYAHQRAVWETENPAGHHYAGVDYLTGYREAYGD